MVIFIRENGEKAKKIEKEYGVGSGRNGWMISSETFDAGWHDCYNEFEIRNRRGHYCG